MAIKVNANMSLGAAEFLDARQSVETLNELLALNTNIIPDGFECYVKEADRRYKYHSDYTDENTGHWKPALHDDTLTTNNKTFAGAINELDAEIGEQGVKGVPAVEEAYVYASETEEGVLLVVADDTADIDTTTQITVTDANQYGGSFIEGDYVKYQAPVDGVPGIPGTGIYGYIDATLGNAGALKGQDGISPVVTATRQDDGVLIDIIDVNGMTSALVKDGEPGYSPIIAENSDNTDAVYKLDITTKTESYTTPNLIGKQGIQGIQGPIGERGEVGATGEDGVSPTVSENADNDGSVYKLDITTANSSFTTPNLVGPQGIQGIQGEKGDPGPQGEQGIQGIQGIPGEKGADGFPFLIYKEYTSLDEFNSADFPEIGLMFMVKTEDADSQPVYRYTGEADTPYSHITDMATTEGLKGEKGDPGPQGEQGIQGERGEAGKDGFTYKPIIGTVTTVDATQSAEVSIVTDEASQSATFNFRIPRGGVGQQGLTGKTGETGAAGKDGTTYVPEIGTVNTVESNNEAKASVELDGDRAKFSFDIPRGVGIRSIMFTSSTDESNEAGKPEATDTYTITYTDGKTSEYKVYNGADGDTKPLPLLFDSGGFTNTAHRYYRIINAIHPGSGLSTNTYNFNFLLNTRANEEIEIFTAKNDYDYAVGAVRHFSANKKIYIIRRNGNDLYVALAAYANFFRIYHKSGVIPDGFAVEQVTSIPSEATTITIQEQTTVTLKINATSALQVKRSSLTPAFINFMDVYGNLYTLQCGDQSNRFYVLRSAVGELIDVPRFSRTSDACYLYPQTYTFTVLQVVGDLSFTQISKSSIPSTAEVVNIS